MMRSLGVRDVIMGEFAALGIIGGGAGLGEPYYNGRTADESKPPGWTPDPAAWDPYYNRKTGRSDDPFYNTLRASPRFPSLPEPPPTDPSDYTLQGGLSISFSIPFGDLASATSVPPYPTFEMKTEMGTDLYQHRCRFHPNWCRQPMKWARPRCRRYSGRGHPEQHLRKRCCIGSWRNLVILLTRLIG